MPNIEAIRSLRISEAGNYENIKSEYLRHWSAQETMDHVMRSASRSMVLVSGGSMADEHAALKKCACLWKPTPLE